MKSCRFFLLMFLALGAVSNLDACDQCGSSACDSCATSVPCQSCDGGCDSITACNSCYSTAHCDDEGLLDKSASVFDKINKRTKSLFGLKKKRGSSCDSGCDTGCCAPEPSCGCETASSSSGCGGLIGKLLAKKKSSGPSCGCEIALEPSCGCETIGNVCDGGCQTSFEPACGCETASPSCQSGSGGLLSKLFSKSKKSDPSCGCEIAPEPSCGCETPSGICDGGCQTTYAPSCGCESVADCSCGGSSSGGLFEHLFKKKSSSCDSTPSCGCETAPACDCEVAAPSCGCESTSACGCQVEPTCGAEAPCLGGSGLFSKLFKKSKDSGCDTGECADCTTSPSCGCEVAEPSCGCETAAPSCGCESPSTCNSCQSAQPYAAPAQTMHMYDPAPVVDPHVAAPGVVPTPISPTPAPHAAESHSSRQPLMNLDPVPAPAPPTETQPAIESAPMPDSQIDPFMDDAVNRVRRVPAKAINYRMNSESSSKPAYGATFDPQASNSVRLRMSDINSAVEYVSVEEGRAGQLESQSVVPASATRKISREATTLPNTIWKSRNAARSNR